jgi:hypothetical protein
MTEQNGLKPNGNLENDKRSLAPLCAARKISDEFACRLAVLSPSDRVRAVVLPAPYLVSGSKGERTRGEEREAIVREARTRTEDAFAEIDSVLAATGGHRLTTNGNALGFIVVETNADGIVAIANLSWVGTVMEDQSIRPVYQAGSANTR